MKPPAKPKGIAWCTAHSACKPIGRQTLIDRGRVTGHFPQGVHGKLTVYGFQHEICQDRVVDVASEVELSELRDELIVVTRNLN